ncbi:hypothetical protein A2881_02190 [Candidatus Peribacteria bacterium RIFCSPHIGHO2_01_FULL_55_13]|nr:MAG: hypothetical protein A2881_02190 [Candidatus Peribacteria bacterium RIFCSPHIGHO2_01_FULL_55_13]OGJ64359.1 MAG: hypothetical protein A3F36_01050 [Candidatus Peribacteria bacterium RIFCSPHIGHO2_12_FULL_55_11]
MSFLPPFTVFDVETTGLDPKRGHRIIEIAAVRIEGGVIQGETAFQTYVNPERLIPWEAKQVNKIDDTMVANAPTIDQVLPQFLTFAEGSTLLAHNANFDMGFLQVEKDFCWGYVDLPECLCSLVLSRSIFPQEFRHNLDVLALRCGLVLPTDRHRALPDVLLTAQAFLKMMEKGNIRSLDELRKRAAVKQLARN